MTAMIVAVVMGQNDVEMPAFGFSLRGVPNAIDRQGDEYRYFYRVPDTIQASINIPPTMVDRHLVSRDLVRWSPGPDNAPAPKPANQVTLLLDGDPSKPRTVTFTPKGYAVDHIEVRATAGTNPLVVGKRCLQILGLQRHVPHELTLITTPDGPRIARIPVREFDVLHRKAVVGARSMSADSPNPLAELRAKRFDVQTKFRPGKSTVVFRVRGVEVSYNGATEILKVGPQGFKLPLTNNEFEFRMVTPALDVEFFFN
ncbi:MAG TPA: hypothetical protein VHR72_08990, partial [Gemmataceae bacterium]|nr:hypothetical protein [Gemmataceae bacterium]